MYIELGILFFILYVFSLLFFFIGILKIPSKSIQLNQSAYNISIILCVRNGGLSLPNILNDLQRQTYSGNLEFIIVDDESTDNTKMIIKKFAAKDNRFLYFSTRDSDSILKYKKRALDLGIKNAKYDWLLFTDVDCRLNKNWVLSMSNNFDNSDYVIGLSEVNDDGSLCSKFQSIDFRMLMISACSSTIMNYPLACTGQNQSYKKNVFKNVEGYSKIFNLLQGDDSIFLQLCRKNKNLKVTFSINKNSHVIAKTHNKWKNFILQRIRWAGDANIMWKYNKLFFLIILSTFFANFFIISLLFCNALNLFFTLVILKFIFEFLIYFIGSKKMQLKINNLFFIQWYIIQIPYIVFMGFSSFFVSHLSWKGRN
tara:strand:+ start:390 stop:1496 length:1107 start_codon:yes stop_codon:yes gene_type:complete